MRDILSRQSGYEFGKGLSTLATPLKILKFKLMSAPELSTNPSLSVLESIILQREMRLISVFSTILVRFKITSLSSQLPIGWAIDHCLSSELLICWSFRHLRWSVTSQLRIHLDENATFRQFTLYISSRISTSHFSYRYKEYKQILNKTPSFSSIKCLAWTLEESFPHGLA